MAQDTRLTRRLLGVLKARLPEAALDEVDDPRGARGKRWQLGALLKVVVAAMCAGRKSLAEVEMLTAEMAPAARRILGIARRVPDTTLRENLVHLEPRALNAAMHAMVSAAHRRKALEPVGLPFGVVSIDGKATALEVWDAKYAQRQEHSSGPGASGIARTQTCALVSSRAQVCVHAEPIPVETNEMGNFGAVLAALELAYGRALFRVVRADAGVCSRNNAQDVLDHGWHYVFGLKETHPTLLREARRQLAEAQPEHAACVTEAVDSTYTVVRRLYLTAEMAGFEWEHLGAVLRVTREKIDRRDGRIVQMGERYFVSSLRADALSPGQWLGVVREHWGVENRCHNTWDTVFEEDQRPWIEASPQGMVNVALLRRIAYNALALFRSVTQRSDERRRTPWRDLTRAVYNALIVATNADIALLRTRGSLAVTPA
jgi:hypothetical protein